tara:strand:- start:862 stop:1074 length:213 start_codon:yes stop_codon:yes gene_type:complete
MNESNKNPLGLESKLYTVEEFGAEVRKKFGGDNYISNVMLAELFLAKYPVYSCKIKKSKNHISQKSCGCC